MKNITTYLVLVALLLLASPAALAQKRFDVKPFGLMNSETKTMLYLGQGREEALKALGPPAKKDNLYSEIERTKVDVWYYNRNKLYFLNDALVTFELHDNTLVFGKSFDEAFSVGAKITGDGTQMTARGACNGASFLVNHTALDNLKVDNKPGKSVNIQYNRIASNYTKYGDAKMDSYFEMLFDANDKVVFVGLRD